MVYGKSLNQEDLSNSHLWFCICGGCTVFPMEFPLVVLTGAGWGLGSDSADGAAMMGERILHEAILKHYLWELS